MNRRGFGNHSMKGWTDKTGAKGWDLGDEGWKLGGKFMLYDGRWEKVEWEMGDGRW